MTTTEIMLALPDPQSLALAQVRTALIPRVRVIRGELREAADMAGAQELRRRLEAFRRYVTDRVARKDIEAETRRTEMLIGELLGEGERGGRQELNEHARLLTPRDRVRFRLLFQNEGRVEELLEQGFVSRRVLLQKIAPAPNGHHTPSPTGVFTTITADPPWQYDNRATRAAASNHYPTLGLPELCALEVDGRPVAAHAAPDAHLYLWTTNGFLRQAFDVLEAWGFTYKTSLVWVKPQLGIGNYFRSSHEFVLFGVKGDLHVLDSNQRSWFEAPRGRHSRKPDMFYDLVEKVSPGPYLELFARADLLGSRSGWTPWGNEA